MQNTVVNEEVIGNNVAQRGGEKQNNKKKKKQYRKKEEKTAVITAIRSKLNLLGPGIEPGSVACEATVLCREPPENGRNVVNLYVNLCYCYTDNTRVGEQEELAVIEINHVDQ